MKCPLTKVDHPSKLIDHLFADSVGVVLYKLQASPMFTREREITQCQNTTFILICSSMLIKDNKPFVIPFFLLNTRKLAKPVHFLKNLHIRLLNIHLASNCSFSPRHIPNWKSFLTSYGTYRSATDIHNASTWGPVNKRIPPN